MAESNALPKSAGSSPTDLHGCPEREELLAFHRGTLPLALIKSVATHIQKCAACESNLSTLLMDGDTRSIPRPAVSPADHQVNVQIEDSARLVLADLPIDFSRVSSNRLRKGSTRILDTPLQLGQYRLIEKIGQGGMGVVYKAWHERLHREVAIKFLPAEEFNDPIGIERMQREMAATGTLRHPNIVFATDAGESEGVHFLVMEHVPGIDLSRLLTRLGPLPLGDACELVRQAAMGLDHINSQGMVHRDLKPSNLMLSLDGTVKILDLGLARLKPDELDEEQLTRKNYMLGTADYVAPEQAVDARTADIRSDIYSLGCTLFKLITGEALYGGDMFGTWDRKLEAHREAPLPDLAGPHREIPVELQAILRKALAKNARDRYQTPGDLARALAPHAKTHHLAFLLREVGLVPAPAALHLNTPDVETILEETSAVPARSVAGTGYRIPKLSRWQQLAIATFLTMGMAAIVLAAAAMMSKVPSVTNAKEIRFNAVRGESSLVIDPDKKTITVNAPDSRQLVSLGKLAAKPKRFAVTIEQPERVLWEGQSGIFFGYREEPVHDVVAPGTPRRQAAVFQVLYLERYEMPGQPPQLRWERKLVQLDPKSQSILLRSRKIAVSKSFPASQTEVRVELEFDATGISSFKMNGMDCPELCGPVANQVFQPRDYEGLMGFYTYNYDKIDVRFSSILFSSLEKE